MAAVKGVLYPVNFHYGKVATLVRGGCNMRHNAGKKVFFLLIFY